MEYNPKSLVYTLNLSREGATKMVREGIDQTVEYTIYQCIHCQDSKEAGKCMMDESERQGKGRCLFCFPQDLNFAITQFTCLDDGETTVQAVCISKQTLPLKINLPNY
jgi:hypothetical protein